MWNNYLVQNITVLFVVSKHFLCVNLTFCFCYALTVEMLWCEKFWRLEILCVETTDATVTSISSRFMLLDSKPILRQKHKSQQYLLCCTYFVLICYCAKVYRDKFSTLYSSSQQIFFGTCFYNKLEVTFRLQTFKKYS